MTEETSNQEKQEAASRIQSDELQDRLEEARREGDIIRVIHKLTAFALKGYQEIGEVNTSKGYSGGTTTTTPSFTLESDIGIGNRGYVTLWDRLDYGSRLRFAAWFNNTKLRCAHGVLGLEGVIIKKDQWKKRWKKLTKKTEFESLFEDKKPSMDLADIVGDII